MVDIPRFNAQIQSLQVPSMKDYQEEQNNSIVRSLDKFGRDVLYIANDLSNKNKETIKQQEKAERETEKFLLNEAGQTAYNGDTFNSVLSGLNTIAEETAGNPAEYINKADAFLNGVFSETQTSEEAQKPAIEISNLHEKESLEIYNSTQNSADINKTQENIYVAENLLTQSANSPATTRAQKFSIYYANLRAQVLQAIKSGVIKAAEGEEMLDTAAKNYGMETYRLSMEDPSLSSKEKMAIRKSFLLGETGNLVLDKRSTYEERQDWITTVDASIQSGLALQKQMAEKNEDIREKQFKLDVAKTNYEIITDNTLSPKDKNAKLDALAKRATTAEEYERVQKLRTTGFVDDTSAVNELEYKKLDGSLTLDLAQQYFDDKLIGNQKFAELTEYFDTPLYSNQQSRGYKNAVERIQATYPITRGTKINVFYNRNTGELQEIGGNANEKMYIDSMKELNEFASTQAGIPASAFNEKVNEILAKGKSQKEELKQNIVNDNKNDINTLLNGTSYNYEKIEKDFKEINDENKIQSQIYSELKKIMPKEQARERSTEIIKLYRNSVQQ